MPDAATRLTNSDIAKAIGMSVSGVSRLRSGNRQASIAIVHTILDTYCLDDQTELEGMRALGAGGQAQAQFLSRLWG